jgi:cysteine synthase A
VRTAVGRRLASLASLVGNTPLLALRYALRGRERTLYAKAEHLNLTGSIKDRMAMHILARAVERGALRPDAFVAGVGTGGTIMGVGRALRARQPAVRLHPLEPANSPTLSTGHKVGRHRIQGISDEFIPPIVHLSELDEVIAVDDGDAILMARKLAESCGLGLGISSGANVLGAARVQERMGGDAAVVTVFPDDNQKYLSTDLLRVEPERPEHLSPQVELLGVEAIRRACRTCRMEAEQRLGAGREAGPP